MRSRSRIAVDALSTSRASHARARSAAAVARASVSRTHSAYNGTTIVDLSPSALSAQALAVNAHGDAVGIDYDHAALFSGGQVIDLNGAIVPDPDWILTEARGINDSGQIAGTMTRRDDPFVTHAFLLTPRSSSSGPTAR
jgi:hypothetical protein